MTTVSFLFAGLCCILLASCSQSGSGTLFDGQDNGNWSTAGQVSVRDGLLTLSGADARAVLKNGKYKDFTLSLELQTTQGGKGALWFHTDPSLSKGYRIAINNDRDDPLWWKMSGSLVAVRNLTKSFVGEDEWFTLDVIVEGKAITVNINGNPVVEYIEPAAPFRTGAYATALLSEGTFALVSEGTGEIQVGNITVSTTSLKEKGVDIQAQPAEAVDEQADPVIRLHQEDFPVLDYHVHLKGGLTNEGAAKQSRQTGINYAIAPNCGIGFPITDDAGVMNFLNEMRSEPFILAMQAEGREWVETFSQEVRDEFDYVFTDALTFTDSKGRRSRIWIPEETWIEDEQQYMDLIVDRICGVLQEPMDIYVNPCFLPLQMQDRYDEFWTEERMNKFVDALAQSGKILEINARYKIPNKAIILKAKAAGVKFSFGTNNAEAVIGKLEYCIRMKEECGLTAQDMYKPDIKI
ncbi:MAG: DUF1080 domain-containing protein [Tannerellaceae bacterium]|jgi:hypothetical protein|nr:DUF1080 domain-containing protein [Tannerellaceae bacterium]